METTKNNLDIIILTKTWIKDDDQITPMLLCPIGFNIVSYPRGNRMGGGIGLLNKKDIKVTPHKMYRYPSMEFTDFKINISKNNDKLHLTLIYRPPDKIGLQFNNDLTDYLEENILESGEIMLFGDFNIRINNEEYNDTITCLHFLDSFNLESRINFSTQWLWNTFDLIVQH